MQRNLRSLSSPIFLFGLGTLLLNDWVLKSYFSNFLTGKLSDFTGLFVFTIFFTAIIPKHKSAVHFTTAIIFILWKSEYSSTFINIFSQLFFPIQRVVDHTDLFALFVLPFTYLYSDRKFRVTKINPYLIGALAVFSFCATSAGYNQRKLEMPQYLLFKPSASIFNVVEFNESYHRDYQILDYDSVFVVDVQSVDSKNQQNFSDEFEKKLQLQSLDSTILAEVNWEVQYLNKVNGLHRLKIQKDNFVDEAQFKDGRLEGAFVRRRNDGKILIKGYYRAGIEDSVWTVVDANTNTISKHHYKLGEKVKIEHYSSTHLLSEKKILTRMQVVNQKYFHVAIMVVLALLMMLLIYRNYRSDFPNKLKLRIWSKIALSFLLPIGVWLISWGITAITPYSLHLFSGFLGPIFGLIIIYIFTFPMLLIIFFTIKIKKVVDLFWWCILLGLLFNIVWEIQNLQNLAELLNH